MDNVQFKISEYQDELQMFKDGEKVGYMSIAVDGRLINVYYTKINPEREGQGYAKLLLDELVRFAEEKDYMIDPECDFVRQQLENHPKRYKGIWHD
ncbi:GNAT family N-acetyltransferase [Chryseobacterium caseinilyticum]|uniref:GNAT family N-acetyltransferase n=1 Tax=Chryseobacterium caseinilyticum TaxID=2771428 RepID=A0ABR8Z9P1_9FLAO|nr:GNAT family N-acetyltransferase [Chryseobacterium caseinilyticum]MBD8082014.1 GNAT family N-acetyltransferase [Chryseobacterium caseinilyticum]